MNKKQILSSINPLFLKGICHRGLHNSEFSENGMKAFENAMNHNMAIELDVHLTKDSHLIVFHDSDTKRMTGKEGIIEDLTLNEIKENYRLKDGETIPTLQEVFNLVQEKVPVTVELKVYRKNYRPLAEKILEELKTIRDKKNILIISFDPRVLIPLKKSGFMRQLLVAKSDDYTWFFRHFVEGVDLEYVMYREERVRRYAKNHFTNVWTIETKEVFDEVIPYTDTVTFQHMDADYVNAELCRKNGLQ